MTKIINLFGGPGTGKSSTGALLFHTFKQNNINCELVGEVAKDLVWQSRLEELGSQFTVVGKQTWRINSLLGKVSYIITDSPIIMSTVYISPERPLLKQAIIEEFNSLQPPHENINIFLTRSKPYNPLGRLQTEQEAVQKDKEIRDLLDHTSTPYLTSPTDETSIKELAIRLLNSEKEPFV